MQLSTGSLYKLNKDIPFPKPIFLQLMDVKGIAQTSNPQKPRHRLQMHDGQYMTTVMPSTQLQETILNNMDTYRRGAILKVNEIIANCVNGKKVYIAINLEVAGYHPEIIGNPVPMGENPAPPPGEAGAAPMGMAPMGSGAPPVGMQYGAGLAPMQPGVGMMPQGQQPGMATGGGMMPGQPGMGGGVGGAGAPMMPQQGPLGGMGPQQQQQQQPQGGGMMGGNMMPQQPQGGMGSMGGGMMQQAAGFGGAPMGAGMQMGGQPAAMAGMGGGAPAVNNMGGGGFVPNSSTALMGGSTQMGMGGPSGTRAPLGGFGMGVQGGGGMAGGFGGGRGMMTGSGPVVRNEGHARIVPIASLNPYSGRWSIKARCTTKGDRKRFNNARGDGQLFSFDLLDQQGSDIRVTGFGDVVDKFFDLIEVGNVYIVSRASLLPKKPQFNHTSHQFEIRLDKDSTIEAANDEEATRIPQIIYNFKKIEDLERMDVNQMVDIIGVVEQVNESQLFTRKDGGETRKRSIVLRDMSNKSIDLTLWGNFADNPGDGLEEACRNGVHPILAAKCVRLGDFGGRSLSTVSSSQVRLEMQHPEAIKLQNWYQQGGASMAPQAITTKGMGKNNKLTTLGAVKAEELWKTGKPEWISVVATIKNLPVEGGASRKSIVYEACPNVLSENNRQCQKKLTELEQGSGVWSCARCGTLDAPLDYRYMASMEISDHTAAQWVTAFGESAEAVFGMSARDFRQNEEYNQDFANTLQDERNFTTWTFRLKVYEDTYQDVARMKAQVQALSPVDFAKEGWCTLDLISKLEAGVPVLQARSLPAGPAAPHPMAMAAQPGGLVMQQPAGMTMQNPYGGPPPMAAAGGFNNQGGNQMMGGAMMGGNMGNVMGGGGMGAGMMGGNMGAMGSSMAMGNMGMAGPQMGSGMGMGGNMMGGGNMGMQQQVGMMSPGGGMAGMQGGPMMNAQGGMGMAGGGMGGQQLFPSPMRGGNPALQQQQQQQQGITGQPLW